MEISAEISAQFEAILLAAALLSGFIDAIAGGGGLVVMPFLLLSGMSPIAALGTSKLQAMGSTFGAAISYARQGLVDLRMQALAALLCAIAAYLGARSVALLPLEWLNVILPIVLICIALYFAFKKNLSDEDRIARMSTKGYSERVAPLIAYYDGIFGPGAGTFYMLGFVGLAGRGLTRATAHTKLLNLASNFGAFIAFATLGAVNWRLGLMMGVCQIIGASIGARLGAKKGARIIRPLIVVVTIALAIRLLIRG